MGASGCLGWAEPGFPPTRPHWLHESVHQSHSSHWALALCLCSLDPAPLFLCPLLSPAGSLPAPPWPLPLFCLTPWSLQLSPCPHPLGGGLLFPPAMLPPSSCCASPSLALPWPEESRAGLCLAPQPEAPLTSAWGPRGPPGGPDPDTAPPRAHRPCLGETCKWMLPPSTTVSGLPSGTSTDQRSVGERRGRDPAPPCSAP